MKRSLRPFGVAGVIGSNVHTESPTAATATNATFGSTTATDLQLSRLSSSIKRIGTRSGKRRHPSSALLATATVCCIAISVYYYHSFVVQRFTSTNSVFSADTQAILQGLERQKGVIKTQEDHLQQSVLSFSSAVSALQQSISEIPYTVHTLSKQQTSGQSQDIQHKLSSLTSSPNTIVTAYFSVKSKYGSNKYDNWMMNIMSIQDHMVIFTQSDMVDKMKELRSNHGEEKTVIIEMDLYDLPISKLHGGKAPSATEFWQHQLDIDVEKKRHQSYQLFWIWLSKTWWTKQAIQLNFFSSDFFVWSDIGCFRNGQYNGKQIVRYPDVVPNDTLMWMAHHPPNPPSQRIWNAKFVEKKHFYHSGSMAAGNVRAWDKFHAQFAITLDEFVEADLFVGEDQCVLQATCSAEAAPNDAFCTYLPFDQVADNFYFGLRYILNRGPGTSKKQGGQYRFWSPVEGWEPL